VGIREILVGLEVATAVVLLVSAGLLLKSFAGLRGIDPGFDREGLVTVRLELPEERYDGDDAWLALYDQLRHGLDAALPPELGNATVASGLVENLEVRIGALTADGAEERHGARPRPIFVRGISPGHFRLLGIPLLQGREFLESDGLAEEPVVIINDRVSRHCFGGADPIGRRLRIGEEWHRVIGVAASVNLPRLVRNNLAEFQLFFPFRQSPQGELTIVSRIAGERTAALARIREVVRSVDPNLPIMRVALVDDLLAESLSRERSNSVLMALFALTALMLGVVGIYGVVAYSVSRRIREIGIRLALGATTRRIVGRVVLDGMKSVLAGIVVGAAGAAVLGTTLSRLLHEVEPRDPQVFLAVMAGITAVACLAAWLPARRAAGTGPLESLRSE
jgi:predicted permease